MLGHGRQDVQGEPAGLRHIDGDEIDAVLHEIGNERDIAASLSSIREHANGMV